MIFFDYWWRKLGLSSIIIRGLDIVVWCGYFIDIVVWSGYFIDIVIWCGCFIINFFK